jgi:hypothetical protein
MSDIPRHWKPLRLQTKFHPLRKEIVAETMRALGIDETAARTLLEAERQKCEYYVNDLYQVQVAPCGPDNAMLHLCVRRLDGGTIRDWRHLQRIKTELAGPEREGFEIYPRESRLVDTSNKFHIWVLPEGVSIDAIGWQKRDVQYTEHRDIPGMRQRPL